MKLNVKIIMVFQKMDKNLEIHMDSQNSLKLDETFAYI